jgi:hypothetical protein
MISDKRGEARTLARGSRFCAAGDRRHAALPVEVEIRDSLRYFRPADLDLPTVVPQDSVTREPMIWARNA